MKSITRQLGQTRHTIRRIWSWKCNIDEDSTILFLCSFEKTATSRDVRVINLVFTSRWIIEREKYRQKNVYARSHHVRLFIVYSFDMGCSPFCVLWAWSLPVVTRFWATGCTFCLHNFGAIGIGRTQNPPLERMRLSIKVCTAMIKNTLHYIGLDDGKYWLFP